MMQLTIDRPRLAQTAAVYSVTVAAVVLLGAVLSYWTWIAFAPRAEPRAPVAPVQSGSLAVAGAIFGNAPRRQDVSAPTGIDVSLLGVVAATGKRKGYAVVRLEGKKIVAVHEGEEIAPAVTLAEVHPDHVVLDRAGARETLAWPQRRSTPSPVARAVRK